MDKEKQKVLMRRWTLLALITAVLLLAARYLTGRPMPVVDQLPLGSGVILPLPFAIERLWLDLMGLATGPIFIIWLIGRALEDPEADHHGLLSLNGEAKRAGLVVGCIAGILCGVPIGWFFGNLPGIAAGFIFGLGATIALNMDGGDDFDEETLSFTGTYSVGFGLTYGVVGYGLVHGLLSGLLYGLAVLAVLVALFVASVIAGLVFIWISAFISFVFEIQPFRAIGNWVLAEEDIEVSSSEDV